MDWTLQLQTAHAMAQFQADSYHFQHLKCTITAMTYSIRTAAAEDQQQVLALLPALSDFNVPEYRNPDHTWQGDAKLLEQFFADTTPETNTLVAIDANSAVLGVAAYTMRKELLSGEPSAHLEVLAVSEEFRKQGIGQALIDATESAAKSKGAQSITLHVFSNNTRARSLYQSTGYNEELLRCYKPL